MVGGSSSAGVAMSGRWGTAQLWAVPQHSSERLRRAPPVWHPFRRGRGAPDHAPVGAVEFEHDGRTWSLPRELVALQVDSAGGAACAAAVALNDDAAPSAARAERLRLVVEKFRSAAGWWDGFDGGDRWQADRALQVSHGHCWRWASPVAGTGGAVSTARRCSAGPSGLASTRGPLVPLGVCMTASRLAESLCSTRKDLFRASIPRVAERSSSVRRFGSAEPNCLSLLPCELASRRLGCLRRRSASLPVWSARRHGSG